MPQSWRRHSLTVTLHQYALLLAIAYLLSAARSYEANDSEAHLVGGLAGDQSGVYEDKEVSIARTGSQPQPQGLKDLTSKQAPLLKQCPFPPVCYKPSLLDAYLSASGNLCPVDEQTPVGPANTPLSDAESGKCIPGSFITDSARIADAQSLEQQQQQQRLGDALDEERHNFALSKDGAKIIGSNKEAKKASAILDTDGDTFMKNECKADKWFIIELSQVAKVDAFQLSQYELYSSRVKDFEVRGRQSHPRAQGGDYSKSLNTTGWQLLGKYTAAKMKGTQTFEVSKPAWQKYLQFHLISHHGSEPICALNDVLVFGKSAAEDLEDQLSSEAMLTDAADPSAAQHHQASSEPAANSDNTTLQQSQPADSVKSATPAESASPAANAASPGSVQSRNTGSATVTDVPNPRGLKPELQQPSAMPAGQDHRKGEQQQQAGGQDLQQAAVSTAELARERRQAIDKEIEGLLQAAPVRPNEKADTKADFPSDDVLPHNSAGSAKTRHGGTIYDMLVQEIKSLKLQQKQTPRQLAELQRNISLQMERAAAEMSALDQAMKGLQADLDLMQRAKQLLTDDSDTAVATLSDVDVDMRAVLVQLEQMQQALHQVQHRVTAIVLLAIIAWLGVVVLTAPALGQLTWILWIPIFLIAAIGVVWLMPVVYKVVPASL